jgi:phosphomevalonate kinase
VGREVRRTRGFHVSLGFAPNSFISLEFKFIFHFFFFNDSNNLQYCEAIL